MYVPVNRTIMKIEFKEEQKITQWWVWSLLLGIELITIYGIYRQLIQGEVFGDKPMSDSGFVFLAIFVFGIIALLWFMRLKNGNRSKRNWNGLYAIHKKNS